MAARLVYTIKYLNASEAIHIGFSSFVLVSSTYVKVAELRV